MGIGTFHELLLYPWSSIGITNIMTSSVLICYLLVYMKLRTVSANSGGAARKRSAGTFDGDGGAIRGTPSFRIYHVPTACYRFFYIK